MVHCKFDFLLILKTLIVLFDAFCHNLVLFKFRNFMFDLKRISLIIKNNLDARRFLNSYALK